MANRLLSQTWLLIFSKKKIFILVQVTKNLLCLRGSLLDLENQSGSLEGGSPLPGPRYHLSQGDLIYQSMKVVFEMPFTFSKSIREAVAL